MKQHVEIPQGALFITPLAIGEIELPEPDEGIGVTEAFDFWDVF